MKLKTTDHHLLSLLFTGKKDNLPICEANQAFPTNAPYCISLTECKNIPPAYKSQQFYFINNKDGSMRWIFPANSSHPTFLKFYSASSFIAKSYSLVIKLLYSFKLGNVGTSGNFYIHHLNTLFPEQIIAEFNGEQYAIFTGTVGPNRKVLLAIDKDKETKYFVKIPLQEASKKLVENEVKTLDKLQEASFTHLQIPTTEQSYLQNIGVFTNIQGKNSKRQTNLTPVHIKALQELYAYQAEDIAIQQTACWQQIQSQTIEQKTPTKDIFGRLQKLLTRLKNDIDFQEFIPCAYMHGDFTAWNMYVQDKQLNLYDWELAAPGTPMLFDIFHFVFQTGVLIKHQSFKEIKNTLNEVLQHPILQSIIAQYDINVDLHYRLYLLYNISYYTPIYQQQKDLHTQAFWLMEVWENALKESIIMDSKKNQRAYFTEEVFDFLADKKYALLKFSERKLSAIAASSDLDILVEKKDLKSIVAWIKAHPCIEKTKLHKLSFMSFFEIFFNDGSFLRIDLIHQFKRKDLVILNATIVLNNTTSTNENIKVPQLFHDLEYCLLFYFLNDAVVPQKYIDFYYQFHQEEQADVLIYLNKKYNLNLKNFHDLQIADPSIKEKVLNFTLQQKSNKGFKKIKNKLNYYVDTAKNIFTQKGLVITVSGVDGAGKSTIINEISQNISEKYRRKLVVLRHRPSLFPILSSYVHGKAKAEQRAANRLPRQGKNRSKFGSFLRFAYYYVDYLFGQFYVYFKYLSRGSIVIYDRYYFDFINDAKRSNIVLNQKLAQFLYRFIYKPQLNFFLYAPAHIILSRKQELNPKDIEELTKKYFTLFEKFDNRYQSSKYINLQNIDKSKTINSIMEEVRLAI